jgi:hypothetical protein
VDVPLGPAGVTVETVAHLTNSQGQTLATLPSTMVNGQLIRLDLPLASLAPSTYTMRVEVRAGEHQAVQVVAFTVSQ